MEKEKVKTGGTVSSTKTRPKNVASTVATFLNEGSNGFQKIRVPPPKSEPEKVDATVTTFLNEDSNDFKKIVVRTTKVKAEKVINGDA